FPILAFCDPDQCCELLWREHIFYNIPGFIFYGTHRVFRAGINLDIPRVVSGFERHPQDLDRMVYGWGCESLAFKCVAPRTDVAWCNLAQEAISLRSNVVQKLIYNLTIFPVSTQFRFVPLALSPFDQILPRGVKV